MSSHRIDVSLAGYQPAGENFTIAAGQTRNFNYNLVWILIPAYINVTSTPSGATVLLNGVNIGITPSSYEISPGSYRIDVSLAGYQPAGENFTIAEGQTRNFNYPLVELLEFINVISNPSGATVLLNGTNIGATPISNYKVTVGIHILDIGLTGYLPVSEPFAIAEGETKNFNYILTLRLGEYRDRANALLFAPMEDVLKTCDDGTNNSFFAAENANTVGPGVVDNGHIASNIAYTRIRYEALNHINLTEGTFETWARLDATDLTVKIQVIELRLHPGNYLVCEYDPNTGIKCRVWGLDVGTFENELFDTTQWVPGTWKHIAITYSVINNRIELYVDGILRDAINAFAGFDPLLANEEIWIGGSNFGQAISIDEFAIWGYVKTGAEIQNDYLETKP